MTPLELWFWLVIAAVSRAEYELERDVFAPFVDLGGEG